MTPRTGPRALYVYYHVSPAHLQSGLLERVRTLQSTAALACPGLRTELLARTDGVAGQPERMTWMETYTHADGVPTALDALLDNIVSGWPPELALDRHTECFAPVLGPTCLD